MKARFLPSALLCASLALAVPGQATVVLERSLPEMATVSKLVVRGTVVDQQAAWTADHSTIETTIHLRVRQILKGGTLAKTGDVITLVQRGGVVEDRGMLVSGSAKYEEGEQVLVFLEPARASPGHWVLERLAASKFKETTTGSQVQLTRDISDLAFADKGKSGRIEATDLQPRSSFTLDEVRAAVVSARRKVK